MNSLRAYFRITLLLAIAGVFADAACRSLLHEGYLGTHQIRTLIVVCVTCLLVGVPLWLCGSAALRRSAAVMVLALAAGGLGFAAGVGGHLQQCLATGLILAAALSAGGLLVSLFDPNGTFSFLERLAIGTALGLGMLSHAVLLLGVLHLLYPSVGLALIGVAVLTGANRFRSTAVSIGRCGLEFLRDATPRNLFLFGVIILFLSFTVLQCLAPALQYDDLNYHLLVPYRQAQAHRLLVLPDVIQSYFYQGLETLFTLGFLLGGETTALLLNASLSVLTAIALAGYANRLLSTSAAWLAGAFWMSMPLVAWLATTGYVDIGTALFSLLSSIALFSYLDRGSGRLAVLAGVLAGFAVSVKLNSALFCAAAVAVCTLAAVVRKGFGPLRLFPQYVAGFACTGLAWPLVRYFQTGNPVFPFLNGIFKAPGHPPVNETFNLGDFGMGRGVLSLLSLPWNVSVHGDHFIEALHPYVLGPMLLLALGLYVFSSQKPTEIRLSLAIVVLFVSLWYAVGQYSRYLMPVMPLLALLCAHGLTDLWSRARRDIVALASVGGCLLVFSSSFVIWLASYHNIPERVPFRVILGRETRQNYLRRCVPSYAAFEAIGPPCYSSSQAVLGLGNQFGYLCPSMIPWSSPRAAFIWKTLADPGYREALRRLSVTDVLIDETSSTMSGLPIVWSGFFGRTGDLVYAHGAIRVVRFSESRAAGRIVVAGPESASAYDEGLFHSIDPTFENADDPQSPWVPDSHTIPELRVEYDPTGYLPAREGRRVLRIALLGPSSDAVGGVAAATFRRAQAVLTAAGDYRFSCDLLCSGLIDQPMIKLHLAESNGADLHSVTLVAIQGCSGHWQRVSADLHVPPNARFLYPELGFTFRGDFPYHRYIQFDRLALVPVAGSAR